MSSSFLKGFHSLSIATVAVGAISAFGLLLLRRVYREREGEDKAEPEVSVYNEGNVVQESEQKKSSSQQVKALLEFAAETSCLTSSLSSVILNSVAEGEPSRVSQRLPLQVSSLTAVALLPGVASLAYPTSNKDVHEESNLLFQIMTRSVFSYPSMVLSGAALGLSLKHSLIYGFSVVPTLLVSEIIKLKRNHSTSLPKITKPTPLTKNNAKKKNTGKSPGKNGYMGMKKGFLN